MVESLSDYFQATGKDYLRRIYLSQQLHDKIYQQTQQDIRVVIRDKQVILYTNSQTQAQFLRLKSKQIRQLLYQLRLPTRLNIKIGS